MATTYKTVDLGDGLILKVPTSLPTDARVAELEVAFSRVENAEHWKAPIDVVILVKTPAEVADVLEAIEFYTATEGTAKFVTGDRDGEANWHITAPGYWAGPAN